MRGAVRSARHQHIRMPGDRHSDIDEARARHRAGRLGRATHTCVSAKRWRCRGASPVSGTAGPGYSPGCTRVGGLPQGSGSVGRFRSHRCSRACGQGAPAQRVEAAWCFGWMAGATVLPRGGEQRIAMKSEALRPRAGSAKLKCLPCAQSFGNLPQGYGARSRSCRAAEESLARFVAPQTLHAWADARDGPCSRRQGLQWPAAREIPSASVARTYTSSEAWQGT